MNMNYCKFQNTSKALQQILDEAPLTSENPRYIENLKGKEKDSAQELYEQCQEYIKMFEEYEEAVQDLEEESLEEEGV